MFEDEQKNFHSFFGGLGRIVSKLSYIKPLKDHKLISYVLILLAKQLRLKRNEVFE